MSLIQSSNRRKAIKKYLVVAILSALLVHFGSAPVNKQPQQSANTQVVAAVAKPSAPIQTSEVQPEKEAAKVTDIIVAIPTPQSSPIDEQEELLQAAGVPNSEWSAAKYIFNKESTWRPTATNSIGCIGLGQNCPDKNGKTWLTDACPDWQSNPVCQVERFSHYATERYGGWWPAYEFWSENGWW